MREPTYVFKKGEGWVPSYSYELTVKDTELRVGDVVLSVHYADGYNAKYGNLKVSSVTKTHVGVGSIRRWHAIGSIDYSNPVVSFLVKRQ